MHRVKENMQLDFMAAMLPPRLAPVKPRGMISACRGFMWLCVCVCVWSLCVCVVFYTAFPCHRPLRSLSLCASGPGGVAAVVKWRVMVQQPRRKGDPSARGFTRGSAAGAPRQSPQRPELQLWPPWTALPADGVLEAGQHAVIVGR